MKGSAQIVVALLAMMSLAAWGDAASVRREAFIHQGDGNGLPRNSLEALLKTWRRGAIPETDARFTKDGVMISFHDDAWQGRKISDLTWAELKDVPVAAGRGAAYAAIRIPTWEAIFGEMKGHPDRRVFIDDKNVGPAAIAALARKFGVSRQVIYHTGFGGRYGEWKKVCPEGKSNVVLGNPVVQVERLAKDDFPGIDRVLMCIRVKNGEFAPSAAELKRVISTAHRHGVLVNVFLFGEDGNIPGVYARLLELGADSIGTERPEAFFNSF